MSDEKQVEVSEPVQAEEVTTAEAVASGPPAKQEMVVTTTLQEPEDYRGVTTLCCSLIWFPIIGPFSLLCCCCKWDEHMVEKEVTEKVEA
eukprot:snap_masked-scaffold_1-processed-gene-24.32-mRNA-1 protein AED:1.00 eAED:1.00 QI:0/-1/0/0/-1/1/1/0/89